jgi:uncharacterized repeat protein (TIGR03803 family)
MIYSFDTDGGNFNVLHSFPVYNINNTEPAAPLSLTIAGNTIYGTCGSGGSDNRGAIFALTTDGNDFSTLHSFTVLEFNGSTANTNWDGSVPNGQLVYANNMLYGTATYGGEYGNGTVYSLSVASASQVPRLSIMDAQPNVILTWPTNAVGYILQSVTNLFSTNWVGVLPASVVINGLNTVTNKITGKEMFYRLKQ